MTAERISDHLARAIGRLTSKFRESIHVTGIIAALTKQVQDVEDAFAQLTGQLRSPADASGATLDLLGRLVQAPSRGTKTDVEYRAWVAAQIIVNRSFGPSEDLRTIAASLLAAWTDTHVSQVDDSSAISPFGSVPSSGGPIIESDFTDAPLVSEREAHDAMLFVFSAKAAGTRPQLGFSLSTNSTLLKFGATQLDVAPLYSMFDKP